MPAKRRRPPAAPATEAARLCRALAAGRGDAAAAMARLRALGPAALEPAAALLAARGAGYAFAVRLLAALDDPRAADLLAGAASDPGSRECDRLEAAAALLDRRDPRGRALLLALATAPGAGLRTSCWFLLEASLEPRELVLGPWLDDAETRPLTVARLRAGGVETPGSLDGAADRARFREGWAAGVAAPPRRRRGARR